MAVSLTAVISTGANIDGFSNNCKYCCTNLEKFIKGCHGSENDCSGIAARRGKPVGWRYPASAAGSFGWLSSPLPTACHQGSPTKNAKNVGDPRFRRGVAYKNGQKRRQPPSKTGGCQQKWPKMRGSHIICERPGAENRENCSWSLFVEGHLAQKTQKSDLGAH